MLKTIFLGHSLNAYYKYFKYLNKPDERILACCIQIKPHIRKVILLTNDINLRNCERFNHIEVCLPANINRRLDELIYNKELPNNRLKQNSRTGNNNLKHFKENVEQRFTEVSAVNRDDKLLEILQNSDLIVTIVFVETKEQALSVAAAYGFLGHIKNSLDCLLVHIVIDMVIQLDGIVAVIIRHIPYNVSTISNCNQVFTKFGYNKPVLLN